VYYVFFLLFIVIGSASNLWAVMDFSDMMILGMAFPNILGMIFLASGVRADLDNFWNRWKRNNNPDNA
jgi:AGCS family alanine or glycine:cation symporter